MADGLASRSAKDRLGTGQRSSVPSNGRTCGRYDVGSDPGARSISVRRADSLPSAGAFTQAASIRMRRTRA